MAADPLQVRIPGRVGRRLRCAAGIFSLGLVIGKGHGCAIVPFVAFGVTIAKDEVGRVNMKGGGRILKSSVGKIIGYRSIIIHAPRANVFAAHIRTFSPGKLFRWPGDAGTFGYIA